jgi:hypothetical protein
MVRVRGRVRVRAHDGDVHHRCACAGLCGRHWPAGHLHGGHHGTPGRAGASNNSPRQGNMHPVHLDLSAQSVVIQQCFSLTINQQTVLSAQ